VASHSGRIVGFAIGYPSSEEASLAYDPTVEYLSLLMVEPNIWRNGVGGKLLELSAQHSRDASKSSLALWTGLNNIRARRFYERSGCRQTNLGRISERHGPMVQYVLDLYK